MSPQPSPSLTSHQQRPWRSAGVSPSSSRTTRVAKRTFAAPVVRELPPRREARAVAGLW